MYAFLLLQLDVCRPYWSDVSEEHGESFHMDVEAMEERC
jgi:hypothetical protein